MNKKFRLRYLDLTIKSHCGKKRAIETIIRDTLSRLSIGEMAEIVFTPTKEEQIQHIKDYKLICDRCGTNEHLVAAPVVFNYKGDLTDNVEYYCANPRTWSTLFSKCWNHVQAYENRKGENRLSLIQSSV